MNPHGKIGANCVINTVSSFIEEEENLGVAEGLSFLPLKKGRLVCLIFTKKITLLQLPQVRMGKAANRRNERLKKLLEEIQKNGIEAYLI
jgi:hypothetical protein